MRKARDNWPANLEALLDERFKFIKDGLPPSARVLEVGAGRGHARRILDRVNLIQIDVETNTWLDAVASADSLPFPDSSFDAAIFVAVLHHFAFPMRALDEAARVLRPGGRMFISEPHGSFLLRYLLRFLRHEHFDRNVDPYSAKRCKPAEWTAWDGNNAIPDLIFGDAKRFEGRFPSLRMTHFRFCECFLFINSGGVNMRTPHVPLPKSMMPLVVRLDRWLVSHWPHFFGLSQEIILTKS
jgi:SAM-dependent methyltransferase